MEKDYHLSKKNEAEHLESSAPDAPTLDSNDNVDGQKRYHGEGKVKEVANVCTALVTASRYERVIR